MLPDQRMRAGGRHLLRGLPRVLPCGQVGEKAGDTFFVGGGLDPHYFPWLFWSR